MLQKEHRLTDKRDFQKVFHHGQSFANRYLVLYYLKNRTSDQFRVGFSVSKKVGKAVTRNRVKRLLREAFRLDKERIKEPYDLVVIARPSAAELDLAEIRQNVQHLLRNMDKKDAPQKRTPHGGAKRDDKRPDGKRAEGNRKGTSSYETSHGTRVNTHSAPIETTAIAADALTDVAMRSDEAQPSLTVSYDDEQ